MRRASPLAYFDTSVLVKRYVREADSARAAVLIRRHAVLSSAVAPLEALSALTRRRTAGDVRARDFTAILARLRLDRAFWTLVEIDATVRSKAEELVERHAVRTLDAIHLASASVFEISARFDVPFITADLRQRDAAHAEGLHVIWVA